MSHASYGNSKYLACRPVADTSPIQPLTYQMTSSSLIAEQEDGGAVTGNYLTLFVSIPQTAIKLYRQ